VNVKLLKEIVLELKTAGNTNHIFHSPNGAGREICDDICLLNRSRKVLEEASGRLSEPLEKCGCAAV